MIENYVENYEENMITVINFSNCLQFVHKIIETNWNTFKIYANVKNQQTQCQKGYCLVSAKHNV